MRNGRNSSLMPADPDIQGVHASSFEPPGQFRDLVARATPFDKIDGGNAVEQHCFRPDGNTHGSSNLQGEPDPGAVTPAPHVGSMVRPAGCELVQEIAFRPHQLHAVVSRLDRQGGTTGKTLDDSEDLFVRELAGRLRDDRRLDGRWSNRRAMLGVATRMHDLEEDLRSMMVNGADPFFVLAKL
jgi:hypothetical protein